MARGDYPSTKQDQYMVRFPDGVRDQLKAEAEKNGRSMNAEIVARLEESFSSTSRPVALMRAYLFAQALARAYDTIAALPRSGPPGATWRLNEVVKNDSTIDKLGQLQSFTDQFQGEIDAVVGSGIELEDKKVQRRILAAVREAVDDMMDRYTAALIAGEMSPERIYEWMQGVADDLPEERQGEAYKTIEEIMQRMYRALTDMEWVPPKERER